MHRGGGGDRILTYRCTRDTAQFATQMPPCCHRRIEEATSTYAVLTVPSAQAATHIRAPNPLLNEGPLTPETNRKRKCCFPPLPTTHSE